MSLRPKGGAKVFCRGGPGPRGPRPRPQVPGPSLRARTRGPQFPGPRPPWRPRKAQRRLEHIRRGGGKQLPPNYNDACDFPPCENKALEHASSFFRLFAPTMSEKDARGLVVGKDAAELAPEGGGESDSDSSSSSSDDDDEKKPAEQAPAPAGEQAPAPAEGQAPAPAEGQAPAPAEEQAPPPTEDELGQPLRLKPPAARNDLGALEQVAGRNL